MFDETDVVREGTEDFEKNRCCELRHTQSCKDPQDVTGPYRWFRPPMCSNKDALNLPQGNGFTLSVSYKPVTLAPMTVG